MKDFAIFVCARGDTIVVSHGEVILIHGVPVIGKIADVERVQDGEDERGNVVPDKSRWFMTTCAEGASYFWRVEWKRVA